MSLSNCLRYPVIGTYRSLLLVVLRNERMLRDKKNLVNVVFILVFLYSLAIYIPLLYIFIIIINYMYSNCDYKELRSETHRARAHFNLIEGNFSKY